MTQYEMVEKLAEKMNVTLEEAKVALEAVEWNMLDAALVLEKEHGTTAQIESDQACRKDGMRKIRDLIARGVHSRFTVRRKDAVVLDLPVIVLVLGLLCAFRACALLLVIGLFAGCRYNVGDKEAAEPAAEPVAEV